MVYHDTYRPEIHYYECLDCRWRETLEESVRICPRCGGKTRNIAVPRE